MVAGCQENNPQKDTTLLPSKAYHIVDVGNGWVTFKIDYQNRTDTYLYHKAGLGNTSTECITKIEEVLKK